MEPGVARSDTLPGGADLCVISEGLLLEGVDLLVKVKEDVAAIRELDAAIVVDALLGEVGHLLEESREVEHDSVSDEAGGVGVEHSRWHQVEGILLSLDNDGVSFFFFFFQFQEEKMRAMETKNLKMSTMQS